MKEFKINRYITLKLEENEINIYMNNEKFIQCKGVVLNRTIEDLKLIFFKGSIDELAEEAEFEVNKIAIPPETEFWVHCSNLQTWCEHDYNPNLLHSNLMFPLLKKLTQLGDFRAYEVFTEMIAKKVLSLHLPTINYLIYEKYFEILSQDQNKELLKEVKKRDLVIYQTLILELASEKIITVDKKRLIKSIIKVNQYLDMGCYTKRYDLPDAVIDDIYLALIRIKKLP